MIWDILTLMYFIGWFVMNACEEYARRWAKKEDVVVDTLSEKIKSIADVLKRRIRRLKAAVSQIFTELWLNILFHQKFKFH